MGLLFDFPLIEVKLCTLSISINPYMIHILFFSFYSKCILIFFLYCFRVYRNRNNYSLSIKFIHGRIDEDRKNINGIRFFACNFVRFLFVLV